MNESQSYRHFNLTGTLLDLPDWASDAAHISMETHFSFMDRLRILLTGKLYTRAVVYCENSPGRAETKAEVWPGRLRLFRKRLEMGVAEEHSA